MQSFGQVGLPPDSFAVIKAHTGTGSFYQIRYIEPRGSEESDQEGLPILVRWYHIQPYAWCIESKRFFVTWEDKNDSIAQAVRLAKEAKSLQGSRVWGEKDLAEEAARETRLSAVERFVLSRFASTRPTHPISARKNNRQQLTMDLLDVWIPATGAQLLNINEGTLGILGCVMPLIIHVQVLIKLLFHSLISSLMGAKAQWKTVNGKN